MIMQQKSSFYVSGDVRAIVSHGAKGGFNLPVSDAQKHIANVALDVLALKKRASKKHGK